MIAAFAEMEQSGEGLAQRREADKSLTQGISFESMIAGVRACGLSFTDEETIQLFQTMDDDGDGLLQLKEFHDYCKANPDWAAEGLKKRSVSGRKITPGGEIVTKIFEKSQTGMFRIVEVFFLVDTDGSGEMDRNEFEVALDMMKFKLAPADIDLAFDELDEDGGGTIEIEEFMARMRREKKWRQEDEEHEHQLNAREEEMRMIEGLTGEAKQLAIESAGKSAWDMARMRMQLAEWKEEGQQEYDDEEFGNYMKEDMEAQLAEAAHAQEEEEARLAEEDHAREEQEAHEAEVQLAKEEAEAEQALQAAKKEELEAKLASDRADKEMREAIAAEKKAARERQEATTANAKLEKERMEAVEAQKVVDAKAAELQAFISGPLADAQQEHQDAWADMSAGLSIEAQDSPQIRRRRGSQDLGYLDDGEFSAADKARMQQVDIRLKAMEEQQADLEQHLSEARVIAEKELAEAVEAERDAIRETMEAEEAEKNAKRERQEAIEAQALAIKEKEEAVEARRIAQKELDDVAVARENAERERREAEEAKSVALRERKEADEAHAIAVKERAEANDAKYKYYSKVALKYGVRWRETAKAKAKARRKKERALRREMIAAAPPTPSVVEKMLGHVGAECYRWEAQIVAELSVEPEQVANRARKLQALRKEYVVALAKEQRRQQTQPGSGTLSREEPRGWSPRTAVGLGGFGTSASSYVPASGMPKGPRGSYGSRTGSSTDRERGSARQHRNENMQAGAGASSWAVRGAGGTLFSARDSARRASAEVTFRSDRQSLSKVVQFNSSTRQLVTLPTTKPLNSPPPGQLVSPIGRAKLPRPPPTPARELYGSSVRDAALISAFERSSRSES
eukprot:COSAG02_NODE_2773_length_8058_cov_8.208820_3_plen_856_part_00